jgi:predicted dehydrogenase
LSALPEFEITAVSTSRQETADETAKHFAIPHAFDDPYKMVQHPDVDLVSICVRVPSHHQLGIAALNAGKHLYPNDRLLPLPSRLSRCVIWPSAKGSTIW